MINIEVKNNGIFKMGYPYNNDIDNIFQNLNIEFINNYNLSDDMIKDINEYKNKLLVFDQDIHEFLIKLSAFIIGFEKTGKVIIDEYNNLQNTNGELVSTYTDLVDLKTKTNLEITFTNENLIILENDLLKVNDLLNYYNSQLLDNFIEYNPTYINETNRELDIIDQTLIDNNKNKLYYNEILPDYVNELSVLKNNMIKYNFSAVLLRNLYETWEQYEKSNYNDLIEYFKDEYYTLWTYGASLIYGQQEKLIKSKEQMLGDIYNKMQECIFKEYNFNIEKKIKNFALSWLNKHAEFTDLEFNYMLGMKRKELILEQITELEILITEKQNNFRKIIPTNKEKNYYLYMELVHEKRNYQITNIYGSIDEKILLEYDDKLSKIYTDYDYINNKFSTSIYIELKNDLDIYNTLLDDLKRQLTQTINLLSRNFNVEYVNSPEVKEKIKYYNNEKEKITKKISDLKNIVSTLELNTNLYSDKITILASKIFENKNFIELKIKEYEIYFDERVPFFTQNITTSEYDGIITLLAGNFFRTFDSRLKDIMTYNFIVPVFSEITINKLFTYYRYILNILDTELEKEWYLEFDNSILNNKKSEIYRLYIDEEIKTLYATVHSFLLEKKYDVTIFENIKLRIENIKSIFNIYLKISYAEKKSVTVALNLFDYTDKAKFNMDTESLESVKLNVETIFDNILTFVYDKNLEFKNVIAIIDEYEKIDYIWLDMEKKYV